VSADNDRSQAAAWTKASGTATPSTDTPPSSLNESVPSSIRDQRRRLSNWLSWQVGDAMRVRNTAFTLTRVLLNHGPRTAVLYHGDSNRAPA